MPTLPDQDRIAFLRAHCGGIGYTAGQPFCSGTLRMPTARDYDLYKLGEVISMLEELQDAFLSGVELTPCQKNALHQIKACGFLQAYTALLEIEESLEEY